MGKIYSYQRFSTDAQDAQSQRNIIAKYAESKGLQIDEIISDEGISGSVFLSAIIPYMKYFSYICTRFADQGIRHILALNPRYKNIGVALCIAIYVAFLGRIAELAALFVFNSLAQ